MTALQQKLLKQITINGENTAKWAAASKRYFKTFIHADPILKHFTEKIAIVLHGSTTRNVDDEHSDLDFWLVLDDHEYGKFRTIIEQSFITVEINGKPDHLNPLHLSQLEKCFATEIDMNTRTASSCEIVIALGVATLRDGCCSHERHFPGY